VSEYTDDSYNLVPRLVRTFQGVPPLHGAGQGFESPRIHSKNTLFYR